VHACVSEREDGSEHTEGGAFLVNGLLNIADPESAETVDLVEHTKMFLKHIEVEISRQRDRLEVAEALDDIEFVSEIQEPDSAALETLLRYRAANLRELKDLLDGLERIRHLRRTAA
jgi:hypothetical protein